MPLRLIIGRANTGKTGAAYEIIRSALKDGRQPVLVVPSQPDVAKARDEFAGEPSLGLRILTFAGLIGAMWAEDGDGRTIVEDATNSVLLAAAVREAGLEPSFRRLVASVLDALTDQTGEDWRRHRGPSQGREGQVVEAISLYGTSLANRGLLTPAEAAHWLARSASTRPGIAVFHRFDDFSRAQRRLLGSLAEGCDVIVTLTWEPDFAPTRGLDALVDELPSGSREQVRAEPYNTADELHRLADGMFADDTRLEPSGAVAFGVAQGEEAQARLLVDEVALALDQGVAPERIAVTFRDVERHHGALRRAFLDSGIPADFDVRLPVAGAGFGAAVVDVFRCAVWREPTALLSALRSPYSGLAPDEARLLEARVRKAGLSAAELIRRAEVFGAPGRLLRTLATPQGAAVDWTRAAEVISEMFAAAHKGAPRHPHGDLALDASVYTAVGDVVCAAGAQGSPVPDVLAVLENLVVPAGGDGGSGLVNVVPITRLRGRRFDVLVIGGLNADEFPAGTDESALPGSALHGLLSEYGAPASTDRGADFEELLFYEALTRATSRVVLVGKEADDDGQALTLSPLWEQVADRYAPRRKDASELPGLVHRESAAPPDLSAKGRERLLAQARVRHDSPRAAAARRRASGRPGVLRTARDLAPAAVSASQIEEYLGCPYRWFYNHAIGGRELEAGFGARDEGTLAHELLRRTYSALLDAGQRRVTPENLGSALTILNETATELQVTTAAGSVEERVGLSMARQWVGRLLSEDAADESGFDPVYFEWPFGIQSEPVDFGDFLLRGAIDRLDSDGNGAVVVTDYKRSAQSSWNAQTLLEKGKVQVLLYMEVAKRALGLEPVAGVYRGMKEPVTAGVVLEGSEAVTCLSRKKAALSAAEMDRLCSDAVELAAQAVDGMRAGRIEPHPRTPEACAYCTLRHMCREAR